MSSIGIETVDIIEPWLYSTLSGDATLNSLVTNVVGAITPDIQEGFYVTFALSSPRDIRGIGTGRVMVDTIYIVKVIGATTSQDELAPAARRVTELIDGKNVTTASGSLTCARRSIISYPEVIQGVPYLHLGGLFNIVAHSA